MSVLIHRAAPLLGRDLCRSDLWWCALFMADGRADSSSAPADDRVTAGGHTPVSNRNLVLDFAAERKAKATMKARVDCEQTL